MGFRHYYIIKLLTQLETFELVFFQLKAYVSFKIAEADIDEHDKVTAEKLYNEHYRKTDQLDIEDESRKLTEANQFIVILYKYIYPTLSEICYKNVLFNLGINVRIWKLKSL